MLKRTSWWWLAWSGWWGLAWLGLVGLFVATRLVGSRAQQDKAAVMITRPVEIREVATIEAGPHLYIVIQGDTVILLGRVIDSETRAEIRLGQVVVESSRGTWRFDAPFEVAVPAMSVITLTVTAPGYQVRQEVMKAHYQRDVTLTVDIPLEWIKE